MAQLSKFVGTMRGGGARANQFSVSIDGRGRGGNGLSDEHFQFMCRSAQIPALTIGEVAVPYRGRQIFVPGDRTYDAWTITIYNDANFTVRDQFERWMNELQDIGNSTGSHGTQVYSDAQVVQRDRNDRPIRTYHLNQAWPTTIDAIDLAYDTNDVIEEFGVTLRFNYMTIVSGTSAVNAGRTLSSVGGGADIGTGTGTTSSAPAEGARPPLTRA